MDRPSEAYDPPPTYTHPPTPQRPSLAPTRKRKSLMDELLPLPSSTSQKQPQSKYAPLIPLNILRRTGSVAIITIFLLSIAFMASTQPAHRVTGLRTIFGVGSDAGIGGAGWVAQDLGDAMNDIGGTKNGAIDFDQYIKMRTIASADASIEDGSRIIFIGDIHGSFDPLQRLLTTIQYDMDKDTIIHVGDLIAKGDKNVEVLEWMNMFKIQGVRGNHDQPVIQWRAWMEWAGGKDWEKYIDDIADDDEENVIKTLRTHRKQFPKHWKWKGQHWKIAREMKPRHYEYLLNLPLALHLPSLHTFVVHAGMLPSDPTKSLLDPTQPLEAAAKSHYSDAAAGRLSEELAILLGVRQNADPYTLIEMRSVHTKGKKKGKVTKNANKGKPWSKVWNQEMKRCTSGLVDDEYAEEKTTWKRDDDEVEDDEEEALSDLKCSPVNIVYGHAAGRGLDIKKFTKGLDTGCVYGRSLTALILGDQTGIPGPVAHLEGHKGVLVSIDCGERGS